MAIARAPQPLGLSWGWAELCGRGADNFTVWIDGDFGHCFEQLVFACTTHVLLAATSVYYTFRQAHRRVSGPLPRSVTLHLRLLIALALAALPTLLVALTYLYLHSTLSPVDLLVAVVKLLTWLIHTAFVLRHHRMYHIGLRGPLAVLLALLTTLISTAIHLRTVILHVLHALPYLTNVETYTAYTTASFYVLYVLTLIPGRRPRLTHLHYSTSVEDADSLASSSASSPLSTEHSPLIASRHVQYGSLCRSGSSDEPTLGTAEDFDNCLSKLTFYWVRSLMVRGWQGGLSRSRDLYDLPRELLTHRVEQRFTATCLPPPHAPPATATAPEQQPTSPPPRTLLSALHVSFGLEYYSLGVLKLLADLLAFANPILLNYLVSFMENATEPISHGYLYAAGLFGATLVGAFLSTHFSYRVTNVGLKLRAAIITRVYGKTVVAPGGTLASYNTGQLVNYMSTDTDRVVNFCPSFHQLWSLPFQVALSLVLLYQQVGLAFLAGVAFAVILVPINRWIAVKIGSLSTAMMTYKDARVKVMGEILAGIRVIKLYAWEDHFADKVNAARLQELGNLRGRKYLDALCVYFWATTPVLISILTFTTYSLLGNDLTAAKVFTSLALFNMLISPLNAFPWVINGLMEARVSVKRLQAFLQQPDQQPNTFYSPAAGLQRNTALRIQRGFFSWSEPNEDVAEAGVERREPGDGQEDAGSLCAGSMDIPPVDVIPHFAPTENTSIDTHTDSPRETTSDTNQGVGSTMQKVLRLENINLEVKQGSLVGIVGKVGSGKSSLLSALLGEMRRDCGQVAVSCLPTGFGLVQQEAWVQHATLQQNILFGKPYDEDRYKAVLAACALVQDIETLPAGDMTEVGENGVTLSGGQKARVALARAVYQDKDVYLLDDPLAAVDAHVARHLFTHCIMGLLGSKTRILCTHHRRFLREADTVVVMEGGHIVQAGSPATILAQLSGSSIVEEDTEDTQDDSEGDGSTPAATTEEAAQSSSRADMSDPEADREKQEVLQLQDSERNQEAGVLVAEEEQDVGVVKAQVYKAYCRSVGACLAPTILLSLFLMQASRNINDWWLSYWVSHAVPGGAAANCSYNASHLLDITEQRWPQTVEDPATLPWCNTTEARDNVRFYLTVYAGLAAGNSLFTLARAFLFAYGGIRAATVIHWYLLKSILKAPCSFFDTTPTGRILNRFSSDLYAIDDSLPFILNILLAQTFALLGTLVVTVYGLPWVALLVLPLTVIYYFIQMYYRQTSREIKRISSVTLSPIYAHFSETIRGLSTIRALRQVDRFQNENRRYLEENQRAQFAANAASQWLGLRLQMLGVAMVTGVAFVAVLEHHFRTVNPGLVGLALSYALSITNLLSGLVTSFAETEKQMVSVERADQYIQDVPREKEDSLLCIPPFWPMQGAITFHRVCLRYRPQMPLALNNVSFETQPAEKIGVVGRTGAGKSSLLVALFRLVELHDGYITIDGLNLAHLDLRELRSRMAIIPQDPFLYSGSVRENLDPRSLYTDTQLWAVLQRCHLAEVVERLGGLDAEVAERGRQFSVGQRQLICLARAMVTRAKVLCIDEATASVDQETDALVQTTIRREFAHHTVLTIAHRLHTILDNDRVLVLHEGRVAEFDPPGVLLENPGSLFYSLLHSQM